MDATTKNLVRQRASDCCEYCHLPQDATPFITFHIEHVIAKQHTPDDDNLDDLKRLALACDRCNLFKGP
ncbi:MAG: HNH endonuclease, partial [Pirellula sp.]